MYLSSMYNMYIMEKRDYHGDAAAVSASEMCWFPISHTSLIIHTIASLYIEHSICQFLHNYLLLSLYDMTLSVVASEHCLVETYAFIECSYITTKIMVHSILRKR